MPIRIKRVYDPPQNDDGQRVLVDGIWPRGLRKEQARVDLWMKEIAPSAALRKWFQHDPHKWPEFKRQYFRELNSRRDTVNDLRRAARRRRVTLLFAAKATEYNNAVALKEYLERPQPD